MNSKQSAMEDLNEIFTKVNFPQVLETALINCGYNDVLSIAGASPESGFFDALLKEVEIFLTNLFFDQESSEITKNEIKALVNV